MANILLERLSRSSSVQTSKVKFVIILASCPQAFSNFSDKMLRIIGDAKILTSASSVKIEFLIDEQYKLDSIRRFIYLSYTYASANYNFDLFSKISEKMTIFHFLLIELCVGMTYMVMDFFIKQYTGKLDFCKSLNPLLKGLHYGMLLQTAVWSVVCANDLADALRYFFLSMAEIPQWAKCSYIQAGAHCRTVTDMVIRCQRNSKTRLDATSVHIYYTKMFLQSDRSTITVRLFTIGVVWIANFFISTASSTTLIKFFKLATTVKITTTVLCSTILMIVKKDLVPGAFSELMRLDAPNSIQASLNHVAVIYGIGLIGVYDHGTMSPYTTIDNAAVIFLLLYTVTAILRSMIVRILYTLLQSCVDVSHGPPVITSHYRLFVLLPLGTELLHVQKLILFYIYFHSILGLSSLLALSTLTMAKLLHSEFRSVKILYMIGLLCFLGFGLTVPVSYYLKYLPYVIFSVQTNQFFLGAFKSAIIMWLYGVQKFATDIQFWLGFMPTKFYILCWIFLPIILFYHFIEIMMEIVGKTHRATIIVMLTWNVFLIVFVAIFNIRTITNYIVKSNLVAAFKSSSKYGPPDPEERKRRKKYNVTMNLRQCEHNCIMLDDRFDCNHAPVTYHPTTAATAEDGEDLKRAGDTSLTNIYLSAGNRRTRTSSIMDIQSLHYD